MCHHTRHANDCDHLWEIPPIIAVKINVTTVNLVLRFGVGMFYSGRILFYLNTPIVKVWGNSSRTQHPLRSGTVRRQCPSLKGTTWCNKGRVSASRTIFAFYVENTNIHRMKWKMLCYNLVYDRSSLSPLNHTYTNCTHHTVRYIIITTRTYKWLDFGPHKACWFDTLAHFSQIHYYVMKWRRFTHNCCLVRGFHQSAGGIRS